MPTPSSEVQSPQSEARVKEWIARSDQPRRSVFGNYHLAGDEPDPTQRESAPRPSAQVAAENTGPLQGAIDAAIARSFLYSFLANAFRYPAADNWTTLTVPVCQNAFHSAIETLAADAPALRERGRRLTARFTADQFEAFESAYLAAFGHAARGSCPLNELEYGDLKADPLFQPHRLADLAAFYRAFGLDLSPEADERQDHICLELEFLCVLTAKEAYALEHQLDAEDLAVCRAAQKQFLREHLGRWAPAFARRLADCVGDGPLGALADFLRAFLEAECARFHLAPGSEDLLLRPVDEAAESLCSTCGLLALPPGASAPAAVA